MVIANLSDSSSQFSESYAEIVKKNVAAKLISKPKPKAKQPKEKRNWLELPQDVMLIIFMKLGVIGILYSAQSVCSAWRNLCKEPFLFHSISILRKEWDYLYHHILDVKKMVCVAVDRSCGQCVEFSIDFFIGTKSTNHLLNYVIDKSSSLKCLRLVSCIEVKGIGLIDAIHKLASLEELELCNCSLLINLEVGGLEWGSRLQIEGPECCCGQYWFRPYGKPFAIGENLPQLRRLHLCANVILEDELQAMLNGCPYLEYLDIGQCLNNNIGEELQKKCVERIKYLKLPVPVDSSVDDKIICNNRSWGVDYWNEHNGSVLRYKDELPVDYVYKNADVSSDDNFSDYDSLIYLPKKSATFYI